MGDAISDCCESSLLVQALRDICMTGEMVDCHFGPLPGCNPASYLLDSSQKAVVRIPERSEQYQLLGFGQSIVLKVLRVSFILLGGHVSFSERRPMILDSICEVGSSPDLLKQHSFIDLPFQNIN